MNPWVATCLWLVATSVPSSLWLWLVWRVPPQRDPILAVWGTWLAGVGVSFPAVLIQRAVIDLGGIGEQIHTFGSPVSLLFLVLWTGPLEEAAKVAASWPAFRSSHFDEAYDGFLYATASGTGFAAGSAALQLSAEAFHADTAFRIGTAFVAQPLLASLWGYSLGRVRQTHLPTVRFTLAWIAASLVHGLLAHVTTAHSMLSRVATVPVLLGLAAVSFWLARDLLLRFGRVSRLPSAVLFASVPPPSVGSVRRALHRGSAPVLFHWIAIGAFTTTGVVIATVAAAIWFGRFIGLDFSTIEQADSSAGTIAPLVLLTAAVLVAFPIAGYLIAKASRASGVLEPALSAALAIGAVLVMLGLAAPVALVFAIAFAPIAFVLACAGAWLGVDPS